jgi:predicted nucleic acid-binding protein
MPVIDASCYIALINADEPDHAATWAWYWQTRPIRQPLIAPSILLAEVAAAISRGTGDANFAHRTIAQLLQSKSLEIVPVTSVLAERAAQIAADHKVRGCDAVYIALAVQSGEPLVTLDRQQLERGAAVAVTCRP